MSVSSRPKRGIVNFYQQAYDRLASTANGTSWVELSASTGYVWLITHVFRIVPGGATRAEADLYLGYGTGGAESELGHWYVTGNTSTNVARSATYIALPYPIRIPASTRLAMKLGLANDTDSILGVLMVKEIAVT